MLWGLLASGGMVGFRFLVADVEDVHGRSPEGF
jgi:hypothetical protein